MNVPPNSRSAQALSYERYVKELDREQWRREQRKNHKDQQHKERRDKLHAAKLSRRNDIGNLTVALAKSAYRPSAPSLRKKTPTRAP